MTIEALRSLCEAWQKRLRLTDWEIDLKYARFHEIGRDCFGWCSWVEKKKQAVIQILDPNDCEPHSICRYDAERTLVHELLHLRMVGFGADNPGDGSHSDVMEEQAVHALSIALLELIRQHGADDLTTIDSDSA